MAQNGIYKTCFEIKWRLLVEQCESTEAVSYSLGAYAYASADYPSFPVREARRNDVTTQTISN